MMNIYLYFRQCIDDALARLVEQQKIPTGLDGQNISLEPSRDARHGDMATNAAMVLSRAVGMNPREFADLLVPELLISAEIEAVDIAGPGFINITVSAHFWQQQLINILQAGRGYGDSDLYQDRRVNIEFVSANPTGPMHVGHTRGAVVGDALANLLKKVGYAVSREYYVNDFGSQIDILARSVYLRYQEAHGLDIEITEGLYPGDYLIAVGQALKDQYGDRFLGADRAVWLDIFKQFATDAMMDLIRSDLQALGITHDVFFSEKSLHTQKRVAEMIAVLEARGHIYTGVLPPPKGQKTADWEAREQLLFRATDFGDDVDRPLQKSDGAYTYFAADIAYHYDKYSRGFSEMIDVLGADHAGYVKRIKAGTEALADDARIDVKLCQMVRLSRGGVPVKMSKRAGNFITMREVIDEVGRDVIRFIMLTRKNDVGIDFDFEKVVEQSKDNPVFYVQYAHARICSVLRRAGDIFPALDISDAGLMQADIAHLSHDDDLALIRMIASWPRLVETAARAHEVHRIAFFLSDLAAAFHAFWNKGNDTPALRFIIEDDAACTHARLALIRSIGLVIASGLDILGVEPVEEM